jgi:hypothetical protein
MLRRSGDRAFELLDRDLAISVELAPLGEFGERPVWIERLTGESMHGRASLRESADRAQCMRVQLTRLKEWLRHRRPASPLSSRGSSSANQRAGLQQRRHDRNQHRGSIRDGCHRRTRRCERGGDGAFADESRERRDLRARKRRSRERRTHTATR